MNNTEQVEGTGWSPWNCLESIPGLSAVWSVWRWKLQAHYEGFKAAFLRRVAEQQVKFIPCFRCGCSHEVIRLVDGRMGAECRCRPGRCDTGWVTPEDLIPWEMNWTKVGQALCEVLKLKPKAARCGPFNTRQIGCWSADEAPVILTVQGRHPEMLHVVTALVAQIRKPYILLAPTGEHVESATREIMRTAGAIFVPLDAAVAVSEEGKLTATRPPGELFAELIPSLAEPQEEDEAGRALALIEKLESDSPTGSPSVTAVFRLYCVEELTIEQIAKKCRCSVGTVANRLKLIKTRTGAHPKNLRRMSDHLERMQRDLEAAKKEWNREGMDF